MFIGDFPQSPLRVPLPASLFDLLTERKLFCRQGNMDASSFRGRCREIRVMTDEAGRQRGLRRNLGIPPYFSAPSSPIRLDDRDKSLVENDTP